MKSNTKFAEWFLDEQDRIKSIAALSFIVIVFLVTLVIAFIEDQNPYDQSKDVRCLNGVEYYNHMKGLVVKYNTDGSISTCD